MMEKIFISVEKKTRMVGLTQKYIGNDLENLQQELVFKFTDEFVEGSARLEFKVGNNSYHVPMTKDGESYTIPIKNIITKEGRIPMQLVIVQVAQDEEIPVFKSNVFDMYCNKSINAQEEAPDDYEYWLDIIEEKIAEMDEAIGKVENIDITSQRVQDGVEISITNKEGQTTTTKVNDGKDGIDGKDGQDGNDGEDGFSPIATVTQTATGATISITDAQGTTTADISNGEKGEDGASGKDAKINGVNTLTIEAGENITLEQDEDTLTINSTGGGSVKSLSFTDYNYPVNDPTSIAGWLLEPDYYMVDGTNVAISRHPEENQTVYFDTGDIFIKLTEASSNVSTIPPKYLYTQGKNDDFEYYTDKDRYGTLIKISDVIDNLTNQSSYLPLSAKQGSVLKGLIDSIDLSGYQAKIDSLHKLDADLIDDTNTTNKFVTSTEKATWNAKSDFSGDYNDLTNKPTIPVVPTNVSAFTNDAGYTTNTGTITSVKMNGTTISSSGEADLGTVITEHQDISGKEDKLNKVTSMSSSSTDTQYPSAKSVYDLFNSDLLHYKGHVASTTNLPSAGQPSAPETTPVLSVEAFAVTRSLTNSTVSAFNAVKGAYTYCLWAGYGGSASQTSYYIIRYNDASALDAACPTTSEYMCLHLNAGPSKAVYVYPKGRLDEIIYYDDGTTESLPNSTTTTITKPGWIRIRSANSAGTQNIYAINNLDYNLLLKFVPTSLNTGWVNENYKTFRSTAVNRNYAEDYILLKPQGLGTGHSAWFDYYLGEPSPDAIENVVYTVGDTYEIYRCNSDPAWEHWSNTDLTRISGYDSSKTQILKNVSGTFTWVDETQ